MASKRTDGKAEAAKKPFGSERFIVTKARYVRMLAIFVSKEETRYYLGGIHFEPNGAGLVGVSTDGHRMGVIHDAEGKVRKPFICPTSKGLLAAAAREQKTDEDVAAVFAGLSVHLVPSKLVKRIQGPKSAASFALYSEHLPPIDGEYPYWPRVIPREIKNRLRPMTVNARYIADFAKVAEIAGLNDHGYSTFAFYQSGGEADPLIARHPGMPEFLGVQMPMRVTPIAALPEWLPAKEAA